MEDIIPFSEWARASNDDHISVYDNHVAIATSIDESVFYRRLLYLWSLKRKNNEMFIVPRKFALPVGMSEYSFRKIVKKWEEKGLITTTLKGSPLKKWYTLNEKRIAIYLTEKKRKGEEILENKLKRHLNESNNLTCRNREDNLPNPITYLNESNKIYNNINNKKKINKKPARQAGRANFENSSFSDEEETIEQSIKKEKKKSIKEEPTLASLSQRTTLLGTKQKEMTFHQKCAKKLIEVVHEVFHSNNSTSFANWAKEFEKLERINQIEPERIDKVLSYFCEDLKEKKKQGKGSILSYSAGQFRKNFIMIEQFMEQKEDRTPKKIELDKEGKMTLDGLSHLEWPKGAAARLPEAIQKSQKGLTQFIELNEALASKAPNGIAGLPFTTEVRVAGFARVVKGKMVSRIAKLKAYYEIIHERVKNWKNWNGRFDSYILEYKNPIFQDTYLKVLAAERWGKETEFLFGEYVKSLEELEAKADNNEKQA